MTSHVPHPKHPLLKKWLWFIGLYLAGFVTLTVIAYALRLIIGVN